MSTMYVVSIRITLVRPGMMLHGVEFCDRYKEKSCQIMRNDTNPKNCLEIGKLH